MNIKEVLVLDIECWSDYDIDKENLQYIEDAKTKFIGFYSYLYDRYDTVLVKGNEDKIKKYINQHKVVVTFNGDNFDLPILKNSKNNFITNKWLRSIDLYKFLFGDDTMHKKGKAWLMDLEFPSKSLRVIAKTLNFETLKGDIDYLIFKKDDYTSEEIEEINRYLLSDIKITKQLFDKIYDYWLPFTDFIGEENVKKWRWLNSSIASIGYMYACRILDRQEIYGQSSGIKKDMGGRVIEPRVSEEWGVWYLDFASLYPHIYASFNLFSESNIGWHGNDMFKVRGYYDISKPNPLGTDMMIKFRERKRLKKLDKTNPLVHAYKILLNSIFGASYSEIFVSLYTENCGHDCCDLGQQINKIMEAELTKRGYKIIAGDTDSNFAKSIVSKTREQVQQDVKEIVELIKANVPFPQETFNIEIEAYLDYIKFIKAEDKTLKKNYLYVSNGKLTITGLPIKKSNASKLGMLILNKYLESIIIEKLDANFDRKYITGLIEYELKNDINLIAQKYKVNRYDMYSKKSNCIQKNISKAYLDGRNGTITLIKNSRVGKVGSDWKYCTIEEAKDLTIRDLDLTKVFNELEPFIKKDKITKQYLGLGDFL